MYSCTGPSNAVKVGGCNTCELAINRTVAVPINKTVPKNKTLASWSVEPRNISTESDNVRCLPLDQEWCPDGFFMTQYRSDTNHPLTKKQVKQ